MKNLDKYCKSSKNSEKKTEFFNKKDLNIKDRSSLYFQIGLILSLLVTYGLFEMNFEKPNLQYAKVEHEDSDEVFYIPNPKIVPDHDDKVKEVPKQRKQVSIIKPPIILPDDTNTTTEQPPISTDLPPDVPSTKPQIENPTTPIVANTVFDLDKVHIVPVFPGCESAPNNEARLACMSEKLAKHIQKKFNGNLAGKLGLKGVQKIRVQFTIDSHGQIIDIKSKSLHAQLEEEAERVVALLPAMVPGKQHGTPVSVIYNLPIALMVE